MTIEPDFYVQRKKDGSASNILRNRLLHYVWKSFSAQYLALICSEGAGPEFELAHKSNLFSIVDF